MMPRALILAAGSGTRLMPLTADRPKVLVDVGRGTCLLGGLLGACHRAGMREAVVVTGCMADKVDGWLEAHRPDMSVTTVFNPEYATLGNAWSVYVAREALRGAAFIKFDGDLVLDDAIVEGMLDTGDESVLAVDARGELDDEAMKAVVDANGRVTSLGKWLSVADATGESIGVEKIVAADADRFFDAIEHMVEIEGERGGYYEDAYHRMLKQGWRLSAFDIGERRWTEVDTQRDLEQARTLLAELSGR